MSRQLDVAPACLIVQFFFSRSALLAFVVLLLAGPLALAQYPDNMTVVVTVSGQPKTLVLHRYSIRAATFRLQTWTPGGGYVTVPVPPEVMSYRGGVLNEPNVIVTASLRPSGFYAVATAGKDDIWSVGPVNISAQIVGLPDTGTSAPGPVATNTHTAGATIIGTSTFKKVTSMKQAELGYDVSWNFYKGTGQNSVAETMGWLDDIVNRYDNFMARDPAINILLTEVVIRTAGELYVPTSTGGHLNLIYNEWLSGASTGNPILSTSRWDMVASFATDSGLFGTGGYAWGDNIGKDEASTSVSALFHENGHNWNANHYIYGQDTMNGSHASHGALNVQRVITKRETEIAQGTLDDIVSYPEPVHPYTTLDLATTLTNTPVDIDVLTNDWDGKGLAISIAAFTTNTTLGGTVALVGNKLRYTPPLNYVGKDIFVYWIKNSANLTNVDLVHVEVGNNDVVARWDFEETSGNLAADTSGNGHAGTLSGVTFTNPGPTGPMGRAVDLKSGSMTCDARNIIPVATANTVASYPLETIASNFFDPMDRSTTLMFWFKPSDLSAENTLFSKQNLASVGYSIRASAGGFTFEIGEWGGPVTIRTLTSTTELNVGDWYHVAMVIDRASNTLKAWINGVQVAGSASITPGAFIFEGRYDLVMGDAKARYFDDTRFYSRALTGPEITAIYAAGSPPASAPSPANNAFNIPFNAQLSWLSSSVSNQHDLYFGADPVALATATTNSPLYKGRLAPMTYNPGTLGAFTTYYWRVDVVPPTGPIITGDVWHFTTADSPLTANLLVHLTLDNADLSGTTVKDIALAADNFNNTSALTNQAGIIGQSFYFNGSNSSVTSLSSDIIPTVAAATISCWMKTTNTANGNYLVNVEGAWVIQYQGANGGVIAFLDGSSTGNPTANASLNNGAWHHIIAANDGTTTRLYVDGTLRNTYAETIYNLNSLTRQTAIGSRYDGASFRYTGNVDDVGIWSRNLSAGEVNQIYTNGFAGKTLEIAPVIIANTGFEAAEGFTGYVSPNFAALGTKFDSFGNEWTGLSGDVQVWNRSDIPASGVQCLKVGESASDALCKLRLTGTNHGVRQVTFDYAAFSILTDCDFSLSYSNAFTGGWIQAWTTHLTGNNPPWDTKPWPTVSVLVNVVGDVDLLFTKSGAKGVLVDNFSVTAKADNAPAFATNPTLVTNATVGVAFNATLAGSASDPDAFDAITFSKVSGPVWLSVASDGALTGTPAIGDVGTNNFTVRVSDAWGGTNDSAITITVTNTTPPNPPVITPSVLGANLQLQIASQSGYNYVVQSATNLTAPVTWSNISTNSGTGGTLNLSAPISTTEPERFFRVWAY